MKKQYYMNRGSQGQEQVFDQPSTLLTKAYAYFEWCDKTPLIKSELMKSGDRKGEIVDVPLHRPYTLVGLCVYCGISEETFLSYQTDPVFEELAKHLRDIVRQHQLEGVSVGTYSGNLVARMQDKQELSPGESRPLVINAPDKESQEVIERLRLKLMSE